MSNNNECGSFLVYEVNLEAVCPLEMLAELCHLQLEQSKKEICDHVTQQIVQGHSFTFVHSESLKLDPLTGWRFKGEDDFGRFKHFVPINQRNMYVECKVGRANSQDTAYVIHIFNSRWLEPMDYSCLKKIMIDLEVVSKISPC